ncbi:chromosomal replication initiator protein DnaA [Luteolibacter flavescens]|uniref:Chromosomal replication initiator protein DnaA n=1 Tax=Luteolibacter flavescens TaxID=1859460 RepID=A0ABT3FUB2_9BACT|nr:chromosomal replication initiator protein DnaA [Luteolibacter flavescens]MCW1886789.1 chromosomal replication initiator protein DnaA [Luteolibacter flavescens]
MESEEFEEDAMKAVADVAAQWEATCEVLGGLVSKDAYQRWFRASRLVAVDDSKAVIAVPNDIHQVWIETNYMPELATAVAETMEGVRGVRLVVEDKLQEILKAEAPAADQAAPARTAPAVQAGGEVSFEKRLKTSGLQPQFTLENFVVGANSQFAHAACEAVGKRKGPGYNPLFIHGGSGLGKTHLMQAIGQEWLRGVPASRVVYLTCEKFTNEFIDAVRKGDLERFRKRYRSAELMLIDDVQFIGGKERSQEEFFHTFNSLLDGRCQVILTSDRPASEIKNLEPRLVSRFECGLTVEIQPPVFETRLAILQKKRDEWKVKVEEGIVRFLAERIRSNVRRLEGALMRVATFASLAGERVTEERVEHLLRDLLREETGKQVTVDAIQRAVADHFDVRLADMTSRRRPASIAFPRQIAMYLSRTLTKQSLMEIGEAFGGRDHGTVIHAVKRITSQMETDSSTRDAVGIIETSLRR